MGLVNRQFVFARHHLALLQEETNANIRLRNQGVLHSALFHLDKAVVFFLRELAHNYQSPAAGQINSVEQLQQALALIDKSPGEVTELLELQKNGWLSKKDAVMGGIYRSSQPKMHSQPGMINLQSTDASEPDATLIGDWLNSFKQLVDRQRDLMLEY